MRRQSLLLICLLASAVGGVACGQMGESPQQRPRDYPAVIATRLDMMHARAPNDWVAASALVDAAGDLREELLFDGVLGNNAYPWDRRLPEAFEEARAAQRSGAEPPPCLVMDYGIPQVRAGQQPDGGIERLVASMQLASRGTVVGTEGGFAHGQPVTVLEIRVAEWLREPPETLRGERAVAGGARQETVHVLYPAGRFHVGPLEICFASQETPPAPDVGYSFVMWVHDKYPVRDEPEEWPFLDYRTDGSGIHAAGPDAMPEMRASLRRIAALHSAPSFEAAVAILRAEIRRDEQRRPRAWPSSPPSTPRARW